MSGRGPLSRVVDLLRLILATYRLARLIQQDGITAPLRDRLMVRSNFAYGLLSCQPCTGVWAAAMVLLLRRIPLLVDVLALAGGQVLIWEWVTKRKGQHAEVGRPSDRSTTEET